MANLFGKGLQVEAAQPFELVCECGQKHAGMRRQRSQRIVCRACGCALFVLPRNGYPAAKDEPEDVPSGYELAATEVASASEIEVIEPQRPAKSKATPAPPPRAIAAKPVPLVVGPKIAAPPASPGKFWKPFRLLFAAIAVVALGWGGWGWYAGSLDKAAIALKNEVAAGYDAMAKKDWVTAREKFAAATVAADKLGSQEAAAQSARQFFRETQAMTGLASSSIFDLVADADATDEKKWPEMFTSKYAGRWVILETTVRQAKDHFVLDFPIQSPKGKDVEVRADLRAFTTLNVNAATPVIVAAQFLTCVQPEGKTSWIITLDESTGFLWSHPETYEGAGFAYDEFGHTADSVDALLKTQAAAMGVPR